MSSSNTWTRMRARLINRYEDRDHYTQQRAWSLTIMTSCGIILFIVMGIMFLILAPEKFHKAVGPIIIAVITFATAFFLLRSGRYAPAANLILIVNILLSSAGMYIKFKGVIIYEGFTTYTAFMYLILAVGTLFNERKYLIAAGVTFISVLTVYFIAVKDRLTPDVLSLVKMSYIDNLICMIMVTITGILVNTAMQKANTKLVDSVADVREASQKLTEISGMIEASSQNIAQGASEQAASMEETSAMLKEISEKAKTNVATVADAQKLMQDTTQVVATTNTSLKGLRASMAEVNEASVKTARIVQTIDSIAFQTNLLALNAAVEAARAGEAGVGFAVVADEVRNLARKSAEASKNTQDIISSNIVNIKKGTDFAVSSDETFATFIKLANQLAEQLKVIGESSEDQDRGIAEIERAVDNMNVVIQANAASAEETAAVSTELTTMSGNIADFVQKLDRLTKS